MTLHYNMYKPINFRSGLFSELRYMSNGPENFAKFLGLLPNDKIIMVAKFRDNPLRID